MDSISEQNPDYFFYQPEADPFKFAQEFGSAFDTSVIDPSFSSQDFYFPADSVASSSYATDNALLIQPPHGLGLDSQTLDVLGMQNDAFTSAQLTSFREASLTLPASEEVDIMSLHSKAAAPFADPYYNHFQPLDLDDALISPQTARPMTPNPQFAVPITRSLMRGRKAATNTYQYPQFAPMRYTTPHQAAQAPYFDGTFAAMGYGMPYSSMSAAAVNVNIQLPSSDQTLTNKFSVQQQPVAHPSYSYSHTMAVIPSSQSNENLNFTGHGIHDEHLMQPSQSYIPTAYHSQDSTCGNDFPPRCDEGGVSGVQASPQELQHSSIIRVRENKSRRGKQLRGLPYSKPTPATPARPTTQHTKTESSEYPDGVFECCWGGCGQQFVDANKAACQKHLAVHGIRTFGRIMTRCEWTDPESGEVCGKPLQMQSMLKHVFGRAHLDLMSRRCPVCKLHQARGSNIHRHWLSCSFFINLAEVEQKRLWSECSKKPFDWYLEQQETRGVISNSSATDQESA